jgi:glycosyltransferase involved in cell wall biosynthesis
MTASPEGPSSELGAGDPFDERWRAAVERDQQRAMPQGQVVATCTAGLGSGGLGRHLLEIARALERGGADALCLCGSAPAADAARVRELSFRPAARTLAPLVRRSPAWRLWSVSVGFDRRAARELPAAEHLVGFSGQALHQLRRARARGAGTLWVVSPTAHLGGVAERYRQARRQYPLEGSWPDRVLARTLAEYRLADRILVSSERVRASFLDAGISEQQLVRFPLTPDPRFSPRSPRVQGEGFEIVYVGGLSVVKGVPLLVDAVRRLPAPDLRLSLVGGWETRGMRRFLERALAADPRITIHRGDPLERLHGASLYVHPSYEDGFSYATAEALACGVPVIASASTGAAELIDRGRTGAIAPTGDLDALTEMIEAAYQGGLLGG